MTDPQPSAPEEGGSRALRWLAWSAAILLPAILLGYALARFAIDDQSARQIGSIAGNAFADPTDSATGASGDGSGDGLSDVPAEKPMAPEEPLVCEGCGPTLAERELQAQNETAPSDDPLVDPEEVPAPAQPISAP